MCTVYFSDNYILKILPTWLVNMNFIVITCIIARFDLHKCWNAQRWTAKRKRILRVSKGRNMWRVMIGYALKGLCTWKKDERRIIIKCFRIVCFANVNQKRKSGARKVNIYASHQRKWKDSAMFIKYDSSESKRSNIWQASTLPFWLTHKYEN